MMKIIASKMRDSIKILSIGIILIGGWLVSHGQVCADTEEVIITTDKIEYKQGETIKVAVKSNLSEALFLESCNSVIIELKDEQNMWKELNRTSCFANWVKQQIKPGEDKVVAEFDTGYEWEGVKFFPIGTYRLEFTYYLGCTNDCVEGTINESGDGVRCILKKTSRYAVINPIDKPIILGLQFCDKWETIYSEEFTIEQKPDVAVDIDKTEYKQGETVKITIKNNLDVQLRNYDMVTEDASFHNQYIGWGFIERFENGNWIKVEPLWRCDDTCFAKCKLSGSFFVLGQKGAARFPKDFKSFEWNQTRLICIPGDIKSELVGPGRYRTSSTFVNVKEELKGKPEELKRTFYSDEFMIK